MRRWLRRPGRTAAGLVQRQTTHALAQCAEVARPVSQRAACGGRRGDLTRLPRAKQIEKRNRFSWPFSACTSPLGFVPSSGTTSGTESRHIAKRSGAKNPLMLGLFQTRRVRTLPCLPTLPRSSVPRTLTRLRSEARAHYSLAKGAAHILKPSPDSVHRMLH